jgi:hypothetical protein
MFVPRCNPSRWFLGASALVALAVAGCGAGTERNASLHPTAEKRLLSLVARARVDASGRDGSAMHAVLGEFVSEVKTLKASGQLGGATAIKLERTARATASRAGELHTTTAPAATATSGSQSSTAADPKAPASGSASNPPPAHPATKPGPATKPSPPAPKNQQKACKAPPPDHLRHHGNGSGHGGFRKPNCQDAGDRSSWGSSWNGADGG